MINDADVRFNLCYRLRASNSSSRNWSMFLDLGAAEQHISVADAIAISEAQAVMDWAGEYPLLWAVGSDAVSRDDAAEQMSICD
jgi:hypothetical protein